MKMLGRYFVRGLLITLPIMFTIYITAWLIKSMDGIFAGVGPWLFDRDIPGLGLLLTLTVILLVGVLGSLVFTRWIFDWLNRLIGRIPLLETIYNTIQEAVQFLIGDAEKGGFQKVVLVRNPMDMGYTMGLLTRDQLPELASIRDEDRVAVYVPMSYGIGGYTYLIQREHLIELPDLSPQQAMKFALGAGLGMGPKGRR